MSDLLPFIIVGLATGAVYGLAGVGLVLTYRTSGVFNFSHGAIASAGAYLFYEMHDRHGIPWPIAMAVGVLILGPAMGVVLELIGRRLAGATAALRVVATVGMLLIVLGLATIIYGPATITLPQFLPTKTFELASVNVGWDQVILVAVGVVTSLGLTLMLRRTRLGMAMRGVVDDPSLLELTGLNATGVRRSAWVVGSMVASASGILLAPVLGLDPLLLTLLVVQAFGAAAVGRFRNVGLTFVGGLGVGIAAAVSQRYVTDFPSLLGFPPSVPFFVLFAILLASRKGSLFEVGDIRRQATGHLTALPAAWRRVALLAGAALVAFIPFVVGAKLQVWISGAAYVVIFLSLGLLVKTAGQVSLCHAAFVAVGASTFSHLRVDAHLPWPVAILGAALVAVPVGALVAIPAIRLSGVYLALATFGFGILLERMVYRTFLMYGSEGNLLAPRPGGVSDKVYFFVAVGLAVLAAVLTRRIQRGRLGRLLEAVADSPKALTSLGASVTTALVLVFCASAFLAGAAGGMLASGAGTAGSSGLGAFQSLLWLTVIAMAGTRVLSSSVIAALLLAVLPIYLPQSFNDWQPVAFGAAALLTALFAGRIDWTGWLRNEVEAKADRTHRSPTLSRRGDLGWTDSLSRRRPRTAGAAPTLAEVTR
ncbi:MAG TPA: ABC transporter permease [Acidimicrobiia bacterium]|nr:ABC transporter permease [Acidimicrobiia bacterium]